MTKSQAIKIFGARAIDLAAGVGRKKSAISQWPDQLTDDQINLVIGAAIRKGLHIPSELIEKVRY